MLRTLRLSSAGRFTYHSVVIRHPIMHEVYLCAVQAVKGCSQSTSSCVQSHSHGVSRWGLTVCYVLQAASCAARASLAGAARSAAGRGPSRLLLLLLRSRPGLLRAQPGLTYLMLPQPMCVALFDCTHACSFWVHDGVGVGGFLWLLYDRIWLA